MVLNNSNFLICIVHIMIHEAEVPDFAIPVRAKIKALTFLREQWFCWG